MQEKDDIRPSDPEFWQGRWQNERTGWDLGGPHPLLGDVFRTLFADGWLAKDASAWVPGCGRAHCAAELARLGFVTLGSDVVPEAIAKAKELYADVDRLTLEVGNALSPLAVPVDVIFDRAVLCAIGPEQRSEFVKAIAASLKPGGLFVTFAFTETAPAHGKSGPPFGIPFTELVELLGPELTLMSAAERSGVDIYGEEGAGPIVAEVAAVLRRATDG